MSKRDNIAMGGGVDDPIPQQSRTIERQCTIIKRIQHKEETLSILGVENLLS